MIAFLFESKVVKEVFRIPLFIFFFLQGHPVKRRAEKEHERNRRADPSSYQER
jgi:hypothetical protein